MTTTAGDDDEKGGLVGDAPQPRGTAVQRAQRAKDVFSMRLSAAELEDLKRAAELQGIPAAELVRAALRSYLTPGQMTWASVSFGSTQGAQLSSALPIWSGGRMATVSEFEVHGDAAERRHPASPPRVVTHGFADGDRDDDGNREPNAAARDECEDPAPST